MQHEDRDMIPMCLPYLADDYKIICAVYLFAFLFLFFCENIYDGAHWSCFCYNESCMIHVCIPSEMTKKIKRLSILSSIGFLNVSVTNTAFVTKMLNSFSVLQCESKEP